MTFVMARRNRFYNALVQTLWTPQDRAGLLARFDRLSPDARPLWGSLDAPRMVTHVTDALRAGLGEVPVLGALIRSTEFQKDMTELLFIITPRLVKPLPANAPLPTDNFREPGRGELMLGGKMEGSADEQR